MIFRKIVLYFYLHLDKFQKLKNVEQKKHANFSHKNFVTKNNKINT